MKILILNLSLYNLSLIFKIKINNNEIPFHRYY